jgi:hypothetical protein
VYFCGVSIYTFFLCLYVVFQLRSMTKQDMHASLAVLLLDVLKRRLMNLRQLHLFTLYLFGFCITFNIPGVRALGASKAFPVGQYIQGLNFLFYCDAPIFLGFLLLHSLQWAASARVDYFLRQGAKVSA